MIDQLLMSQTACPSPPSPVGLTVGIVCNGTPTDIRNASGVPFFMTRALARHFRRIVHLPTQPPGFAPALQIANSLSDRFFKRKLLPAGTIAEARHRARQLEKDISARPVDAIFSIAGDGCIAFLETQVPVVYYSDATFSSLLDYYSDYSDLWNWTKRQARLINQRALSRSKSIVFPSTWAAESAIREFSIRPDRVHVIPNGASILTPPERELTLQVDRHRKCQLLFVGRDWKRKGGKLAWNALCILRKRGIDAQLIVIGCRPPSSVNGQHVTVHPFLSKQVPEQLDQLRHYWLTSTFLCLPTRAETFGHVLAEAAAYGLPVIATRTGGVSMSVEDGVTGRLLPSTAKGHDYADAIADIWYDRDRYQQLRQAARDRFEQSLNWDHWAQSIAPLITQAVAAR